MSRSLWRSALILVMLVTLMLSGCDMIAPREPVVLRMMAPPGDTEALEELLEAYQRDNRHVTVELARFSPWPYILGELSQAIMNEELDILRSLNTPLGDEASAFVGGGLVQPLDGRLGSDWDELREDSYPGAWEALSYGGQQYGVPASLDPVVVYATVEIAEALGVNLETAWNTMGDPRQPVPWTTDDLAATAETLRQSRGLPGLSALRIEGLCADMYQDPGPLALIHLRGGALLDDLTSPNQPMLDAPVTVEAAGWYASLFGEFGVGDAPRVQQSYFRSGGLPEAAGGCACGLWFGRYGDRGGEGSQWPWECGARMLPLPADQAPLGLAWVEGYYIASSSQHPEEALALLRYLSNHAAAAGARVPVQLSLARDEAYLQGLPSDVARTVRAYTQEDGLYWGRTTLVSLEAGYYLLPIPGAPTVLSSLHQAIDRMAREGVPPEQAMADAQQQAVEAFTP